MTPERSWFTLNFSKNLRHLSRTRLGTCLIDLQKKMDSFYL